MTQQVGVVHDKKEQTLKLICDNNTEIVFFDIIQFELNFFSDQNVIFNIDQYKSNELSSIILDEYPFLKRFINLKKIIVYCITSSVGLSGVIISGNLS